MNTNYETFLIIYRDGNAEFYRNGLPIARTDAGKTTLHQFKDAAGNPLPHTTDHLNALLELSANVGNSAGLLEAAALGLGLLVPRPA